MRTSVFLLFLLAGIGGSQKAQAQDTWVQQSPTASPQARDGAPLAFDSLHQRIVLFGGATLSGTTPLLCDTLLWDGKNGLRFVKLAAPERMGKSAPPGADLKSWRH